MMLGLLADIPLRLMPIDMVLVTAPIANLMILAEMFVYWRSGRWPRPAGSRLSVALAVGGPALVGANLAIVAWHPAALLVIAAMLIVWVSHSYGRTTSPLSRKRKFALIAIRVVIIVLMLLYLLKPTLRHVDVFYEKAVLLMLYDTSRSMTIGDAGSDSRTPRIDALRAGLSDQAAARRKLDEIFEVRQFTFDEHRGAEVKDPADALKSPIGETTAIGRGIRDSLQVVQGRKLSGVVVFSDGVDNAAPSGDAMRVAEDLARLGSPVPLWTVGVGRETPATNRPAAVIKDLALADRRIPAFNVLNVHAVYELLNLPGKPVKVELVFGQGADAKVADSRVIQAPATGKTATVSVDLQVTPSATGFHAVTVRVADDAKTPDGKPLANEFSRKTDYVQVVDDVLGVLYVEGKFRLESQFIISALAGSDLMRLNRQFLLTAVALGGNASALWPKNETEWQKYHVVILGDVKANAFKPEELATIKTMVQEFGKGLLMLGGRDAFGQGGWPGTPVAELMPFDLRMAVGHVAEPFKLTATPTGLMHPLMQLDEDPAKNAKNWTDLPPMAGANRFPDAQTITAARPGAAILATTPAGQPVMVSQQSGKGRVLAMAIDTTWRWRLHLDPGRTLHNRFWRQAVLWLASRQGNIWVKVAQPRYRLVHGRRADGTEERGVKDKVQVTAGIEDQTGKPVGKDAKPKLTLVYPDGKKQEAIDITGAYRNGMFELELPRNPVAEGNYRLVFEGVLENKPVKAETSFMVESIDIEMSQPLANHTLLKQMAAATTGAGGGFYPLENLGKLLGRFKASDHLIRREEPRVTDLGDRLSWPLLVAVLIGLMAEWIIRKRSSLV